MDTIDAAALPFAYCFNGAYAQLAGVSLTSLLHNHPGQSLQVFCVVQDVASEDRARLVRTAQRYGARLTIIDIDQLGSLGLNDLPLLGHLASPMIYARLLLPRLLPADMTRVLYLDADTLVLGSLNPLGALDFAGNPIAAVLDAAHGPMGKRLGLPPGTFFNAGVQLMSLPVWRQENIGERCLDLLRATDAQLQFPTLDQDALNFLLAGRFLPLNDAWNHAQCHKGETTVLGTTVRFAPATVETRLIQYLGRVKPHMAWYWGPGLTEFERFRAASEWHDAPLVSATQVVDVIDMADKLWLQGRGQEAMALLKSGLMELANRLARESPQAEA